MKIMPGFEENAVGNLKRELWQASDVEIDKILSDYDIPMSLFYKFIEFQNDIPKSNMIKHPKSIYIDASFFDRNLVAGNKNIPVFDINQAIELFLN